MNSVQILKVKSSKFKSQNLAFKLCYFTFLVMLCGCAGIDDLSSLLYRNSRLEKGLLDNERVGLMPMFGKGENRAYLKNAEDIFGQSLSDEKKGVTFLSPEESLERIRSAGLIETYREMARSYSPLASQKLSDIQVIGGALGTRYILQSELQLSGVIEGATHVRIYARLWDLEKGVILWEGVGEARGYVFLIFPIVPSDFERAMEVASRGLARKFP